MSLSRELRMLYRQIPAMQCRPGCGDCCGPVPWTAEEWARVADDAPLGTEVHSIGDGGVITSAPASLSCPFRTSEGCGVYDRRPFMCRLFGAARDPRLTCPHGCKPAKALTAARAAQLTDAYRTMEARPCPATLPATRSSGGCDGGTGGGTGRGAP